MFEKNGVAILTPKEYNKLRTVAKQKDRTLMDVCLYTGMRYAELLRLQNHKEWFLPERKAVELPRTADRKVKRQNPGRYVMLSAYGVFVLERFFEDEVKFPPSLPAWDGRIRTCARKAGLVDKNKSVSHKTFRKTWESWLAVSYPDRVAMICQSQGHNQLVSVQHYISIPFSATEKEQIKEKVMGWI